MPQRLSVWESLELDDPLREETGSGGKGKDNDSSSFTTNEKRKQFMKKIIWSLL